ncbi:MAG: hypothetical protein M3469_04900 [Actinomycetota bacterium]|jgi:heme-degrading monooxygenase HmoA|nr:hypothetical protein [Euzebyaceae bacterium]MDQ3409301.1 hypothetical protein [Actinomycetota bacterium]
MAVAYVTNIHPVTEEDYRRVADDALAGDRPAGLLLHAAGKDDEGHRWIVEVWDTEEDSERFAAERLFPAFERHGVDGSQATRTRIEIDHLAGTVSTLA